VLIKVRNAAGAECTTALAPDAVHKLAVRIAIPRTGESHGLGFHEGEVDDADDDDDGGVFLTIAARSDEVTGLAPGKLFLPIDDRSQPSTVANLRFRTGAEGPITIDVTILHVGRPIQAARIVANVSADPDPDDRVLIRPLRVSAAPEPTPATTTPADATIDATSSTLMLVGDATRKVELTAVRAILTDAEELASRVLGSDDAPTDFEDEKALELLIRLASFGSELRKEVADLGLDQADVIAMLVRDRSDVVPLELAYDGPAPDDDATLCSHAKRAPTGRCTKASTSVVCPYAFWGLTRTIARTVVSDPPPVTPKPRSRLVPLGLRPILYAAATRADDGHAAPTPSTTLERALRRLADKRVTRVEDWPAWRTSIETTAPELLVVLGHTAMVAGATALVIGGDSTLKQPAVELDVLGRDGGPAPILLLVSCSSAQAGDVFGTLPATFVDAGAAAVVATLTKINGAHGAQVAEVVARALYGKQGVSGIELGAALTAARRTLVKQKNLAGLLLVAHGEIDIELMRQ
jgi:hypothetical protein